MVRRAAFDFGSGATKLQVSDVDADGAIVRTVFAEEREVLYASDLKASVDNTLSDAVTERGLAVVDALAAVARGLGCEQYAAVATEVFRRARNGRARLDVLGGRLRVTIRVVAQAEEARLGYLTAAAAGGGGAVVSWDSGGGSFQLATPGSDGALETYLASWGSSVATAELATAVRSVPFVAGAANPVSPAEAARLVDRIKASLPPPPPWLADAPVVAIGGDTCIFRLCRDVLDAPGPGGAVQVADVRRALAACVGKGDGDLPYPQPDMVVPKLCLCLAVCEALGVAAFRYAPSCGSCAGLLVADHFPGGAERVWADRRDGAPEKSPSKKD